MPAILNRLVSQLKAKGKSASAAYAIATSALQKSGNLKKNSTEATTKGKKRGAMTPSQRAKDRASKRSKQNRTTGPHKPSDYNYSKKTNVATLKGK
jgi:hypothetical protein